jgi:diadenosine tetraphosphate (Ap4A) HIT family hydrolase
MAVISATLPLSKIETTMFELHPRLAQDCIPMGNLPLCRLLLMNESRYPWFILVPERTGAGEIYQLPEEDQTQLMRESCELSRTLAVLFRADKMNVASIGNLVPQLHIHHVARYRNDPAWPAPVWGRFEPLPYSEAAVADIRMTIGGAGLPGFSPFA